MRIDIIDAEKTLKKGLLYLEVKKAAQAVIDTERPGETVQEVLINTDSATPLADVLNPPAPKATKVVYRIAFLSSEGEVESENLVLPLRLEFNNLKEALEETGRLKDKYSIGKNYFIVEKTVEA